MSDMTLLQAIIMGCIEGITEFLPISSTAHLILTAHILDIAQTTFTKSFEIIVQLGAILAVIVLYWRQLLSLEMVKRLIVAFIPTGVLGMIFYSIIKTYLMESDVVLLCTLFFGGLFLIVFEKWHIDRTDPVTDITHMSYRTCLMIGIFQACAMIPGVSRSAATIIGGLVMGLRRETIVAFSFLLAVPTMMAATGLDLIKNVQSFSADQTVVLSVGFIVAFFTAIIGIKSFLAFIQKKSFVIFGIYRMVIAVIFAVLFFM